MLHPIRKYSTTCGTWLTATAACVAIAATVIPEQILHQSLLIGIAVTATAFVNEATRNRHLKREPQEFSDERPLAAPPPNVDQAVIDAVEISWPVGSNLEKTRRILIVPEGYDPETLASEPFRRALQRYQEFLQQHFPADLITVGIAYPQQSIPSVIPSEEWGHTHPKHHPLSERTDLVLILLNGEAHRLSPHGRSFYKSAVSWGPGSTGDLDFAMLVAALHETLHIFPVSGETFILDSYQHDPSPWSDSIDCFEHSGFLPYEAEEMWPYTLVTEAIKAFDVPVYYHREAGKDYWAVGNRANIMDESNISDFMINLLAFVGTGGNVVEPYQRYLICHGTIDELERRERVTMGEARDLREKYSLDYIRKTLVHPLTYLAQALNIQGAARAKNG